jgi:hypothetical protein
MKNKFLSLDYFNKLQVVIPSFLLEGCDGSRGDEFVVTGVITLVLAFLLSVIEPCYRSATTMRDAIKWSLFCVTITVLTSLVELVFFWKMGKLHGPIGYYGVAAVILSMSGTLLIFAFLCVWADRNKR